MVVAGRLITAALPVASTIVPALRFTAVESRSREVSPATTVYVSLNVVAGPAGPVMVTKAPEINNKINGKIEIIIAYIR